MPIMVSHHHIAIFIKFLLMVFFGLAVGEIFTVRFCLETLSKSLPIVLLHSFSGGYGRILLEVNHGGNINQVLCAYDRCNTCH